MPSKPRPARILTMVGIAGVLLIGLLAGIAPRVAATNSDWTHEVVTGIADNINMGSLTHDGERLGFVYRLASNSHTGFSIRSAAGVWATKTSDVTAAGTYLSSLQNCRPAFITGTTWLLGCYGGTSHALVWKSTDDGATWTNTLDVGTSGLSASSVQAFPVSGSVVGVIYGTNAASGSTGLSFQRSADAGSTWGGELLISDNKANPAQSSATITQGTSTDVLISGGNVVVAFAPSSIAQVYAVSASISDIVANSLFFTPPYTNSCVPGAVYADSGSTAAAIAGAGGGGQYLGLRLVGSTTPMAMFHGGGAHSLDVITDLTPCDSPTLNVSTGTSCTDGNNFYGNGQMAAARNTADVSILAEYCGAGTNANKFLIWLRTGAGAWAASYSESGQHPTELVADMTASKAFVIYASSATGRAELLWASAPTASPSFGAVATTTVTGLVGFDVDPSGATAIARTNGGPTVRTYGASTLTENANAATVCTFNRGVMAISDHVAYFDCSDSGTSGTTIIDSLDIASPTLEPPGQPEKCLDFPSDVCPYHITNADIIHPDGHGQIELNGMTDFPIDYSRDLDLPLGEASAVMAFAFSTTTGDIGVSIINQNADSSDTTSIALANIGENTQPIDEMCVTRDLDGKSYIYAVSTLTNAKGWRVDFRKVDAGQKYAPTLVPIFPGTSGTAGARGVACGIDHFAIIKSDTLTIWKCRASCTSAAVTVTGLTGTATGGIAMADNGQTMAYIANSTTWYLRNTTGGAILASGPTPATGTFVQMKQHGAGSSLWIANTLEIDRYATFSAVGDGNDTAYTPPCHGASDTCVLPPGSGSDAGGAGGCTGTVCPGGVIASGVTVPVGWTVAAFNGFLGVILVGATGGGMWGVFGRHPLALVIGSVMGFILALLFKLFALWVLIVVVLIATAVIFLAVKRSAGGSSS